MKRLPLRRFLFVGVLAGLLPWLLYAQPPPAGKKIALLVGVKHYNHADLADLEYPENDVEDLGKVLADSGYRVTLLTGQRGAKNDKLRPTRANIQRALEAALKGVTKHDTFLVALAGHGIQPADARESYFCPLDARPKDVKTLIGLNQVIEQLSDSGVGVKLLLVDACRNDPKTRGMRGLDGSKVETLPNGVAALFSCSRGQFSFETKKAGGGHGVFFHFVIEGLRNQKLTNERNEVTWSRLADYVQENVEAKVPEWVAKDAVQKPHEIKNLAGRSPVLLAMNPDRTLTVDLGGGVKMQLVRIPAGKFLMGSPKDEKGRRDDEEQHEVEITRPFYMGMHTVTVGQFRAFVRAKGYQTEAEKDGAGGWGYNETTRKFEGTRPQYTWKNVGWVQSDDHPVVNVTWNDAVAFCDWLTQKEGQKYGLPTEAQWEYACRAGTTTRFYSGDEDESLQAVANVIDVSFKRKYSAASSAMSWDDGYPFTAPVGRFKPNKFGLFDMHGNVWQWCADWYDKDYYKKSRKQDPRGWGAGHLRVVRGGSFNHTVSDCRSASRDRMPVYRFVNVGFRVVRVR